MSRKLLTRFTAPVCIMAMLFSATAFSSLSIAATTAPKEPVTLTVSAAASLKDALFALEKRYEKAHPEVQVDFNLGASGALKKQIEEGAPADLFLSADTKNVDVLAQKQLIVPESKTVILSNDLVLIANQSLAKKVINVNGLKNKEVTYIALGTPESVPAGAYAKEALTNLKLWDVLKSKYVFGKDVKQVLNYVETGNAQAGIVYGSDAKLAKKSITVLRFADKTHSPILYGAAVIQTGQHQKEAQAFLTYLASPEAQQVFKSYGFNAPR